MLKIFSFSLKGHLPIINCSIGNYELQMIIDTGAGINVLRPKWQAKLIAYSSQSKETSVKSFNHQSIMATSSVLEGVFLEHINYPSMRTLFSWSKDLGLKKIDGILGYEFLMQYPISINFEKKELKVWYSKNNEDFATNAQ